VDSFKNQTRFSFGEGAKLVKEVFELAREKSPSIIFIDELDALAANRIELGTSGEREVQRTFMQFLAELDGFKPLGDVKVIGCTNRLDILDPAVIRPGRLDRLVYVPSPDEKGALDILKIHTKNMTLNNCVNLEELPIQLVTTRKPEFKPMKESKKEKITRKLSTDNLNVQVLKDIEIRIPPG